MGFCFSAVNTLLILTSMPASSVDMAWANSSASPLVIHPAAANLSLAAFHDRAYEYSSDNGSGECVSA
jgi:hypothetical protein